MYPITVGDFFSWQESPLPWIVGITKKEVLLWETTDSNLYSPVMIAELRPGIYSSNSVDFGSVSLSINHVQDYSKLVRNLVLRAPQTRTTPLYAKDPNITPRRTPLT